MGRKSAFPLVVALILTGCISTYPTDLTLVSIEAVNYRDQIELDPPLKDPFASSDHFMEYMGKLQEKRDVKIITQDDIDRYYIIKRSTKELLKEKPNWLLLRFEFQSKVDLQEFTRERGYVVSARAYFCDRPDAVVELMIWPMVFWQGSELGVLFHGPIRRNGETKAITYYAFLHAIWGTQIRTIYAGGPAISAPYDLRNHAEDICLFLKGGGLGIGFESNVIVIPREVIADALKTLPPPFNAGTAPDVPGSD